MNPAKNCFNLPSDGGFLHSLAGFILQSYNTAEYAKILILLPNRRSCRALRDAFLDCTGGEPLLLPRIQPIGEIEDEVFFSDMTGADAPIEQPIDAVRRHFLLMKLIMRFQQIQAGGGGAKQAAELARQLATFMDEVQREGVGFDSLSRLAPENLAGHWQQTLDFLTIITKEWPRMLEEEGAIDIVTHRNRLLFTLAKIWSKSPPDYPIIAAGSTGSQPATAALLRVIANLPQGKVILPALDKEMTDSEWEQISETHPQYGLKKLLEKMEVERGGVEVLADTRHCERSEAIQLQHDEWIATKATPSRNDKNKYIRAIFAPPLATANWSSCELPEPQGIGGIKLLETDTLLDEARMVAIAMREVLETKKKTVALITPDRVLARMVSTQLQRFGIAVDDSAGKPLNSSAPACFLRLVMEMVASRAAPASLLAVLRHPLAAAGMNPAKCRSLSRELELLLLRGIRRDDGLSGLLVAAIADKKISNDLVELLRQLEEKSEEFSSLFAPHYNTKLQQLLIVHIKFSEWLASSDTQGGEQRLWVGEAGNALAEIIAQWNIQADILPPIDSLTYPSLFDALLATETYHSQIGLHPRLHILSPMEARLQRYDMVVLSSLNEGTWPKNSQPDPWMSRPQRAAFGLPSWERAIGQSAHDFVMQLSSPEVLLTRARKVEGAPTIASRWWVRLQTLLGGREPDFFVAMNREKYFSLAKDILETPASLQALTPPAPTPPLASRPRKLRVTAIDNWLRDPYNIYARYILNLRKLDDIDREPDAADFGNIVHKALEIFTNSPIRELPELLAAGRTAFADFVTRPAVACLWWPRFEAMANWLIGEEKIRQNNIEKIYSEVGASWNFEVAGKPFSLSTRIDRLEKLKSGGYTIVDYKTGVVPKNGASHQLPLEALIVQHGQLPEGISTGVVAQMEYWKLSGSEVKCEITQVKTDMEETRKILEELIAKFDDETTPYSAQTDGPLARYNDYEHLTRRKEWETV
jgi:ATP-dependent helicase/nuclease subunit B